MKERLDIVLVLRGLFISREKATIMSKYVATIEGFTKQILGVKFLCV